MDNPAHGEAACVRYGKATAHNGEKILRRSGRRGETEIVAHTAELEGISNGGGRVRPASRRGGVRSKQLAWRALGPARLRRSPRSRGAGAHAAGARGVLADERRLAGHSNAVAAGLMLAASFGLLYEGMNYGPLRAMAGALLGLAFIVVARRSLRQEEHPAVFASMSGLDARKALLIVGVMTLHSFTEGVGIGVSFGGGQAPRLFIRLALAVPNIPEGLAISLVVLP